MENSFLEKLIGQDLSPYKIVQMSEVVREDVNGITIASIGFFKDADIANAFADQHKDSGYIKVKQALVLSDGKNGFTMDQSRVALLFDDEAEVLKIKQNALQRLSPYERKVLGY